MSFRLPTRITIVAGAINQIVDEVASFNARQILLIFDNGLKTTSWPIVVQSALEKAGCNVSVDHSVEPNPRDTTVDRITEHARRNDIELVIGLGGGSVLDTAKAVAMLLRNAGSCLQYEGKNKFKAGSAPFIAIPTTCGTGSEVTWVSVITNLAQQRKFSIKGDAMFPDVALVDPLLLGTLPAHLIAYTGVDALTHAIEAYTVNCANPVSDALAEKAMRLLFTYLPRLYQVPTDRVAQFEVMRASTLAGMAFGNADVGGVHCLSETIGGVWDVPHGLANAILLAPVMRYHEPFIKTKLASLIKLWRSTGENAGNESEDAMGKAFLDKIDRLTDILEIPSFNSLEIPIRAYEQIASGAVANNSNDSNPQKMEMSDYLAILNSMKT